MHVVLLCVLVRMLLISRYSRINLPEAESQCHCLGNPERSSSTAQAIPTTRVVSTSCVFIALDGLLSLASPFLLKPAMRDSPLLHEHHFKALQHLLS